MESDKPKIPRLIGGVDIRALPLGPMEGFVLSRIDASATLADIADLTSLDLEEVVRIIDKLLGLGVVEWADGNVGYPRATPRVSVPPRTPHAGTPRSVVEPLQKNVTEIPRAPGPSDRGAHRAAVRLFGPAMPRAPSLDQLGTAAEPGPVPPSGSSPARPRVPEQTEVHAGRPAKEDHVEAAATGSAAPISSAPAAPTPAAEPVPSPEPASPTESAAGTVPSPPDDGIDMPVERRKRIDDLYFALDLLNHYDVLGVSRKADKAKVRSSYFEGSKAFHPDTVFRKNVGNYRMKMEAIFSRLTEAYEVLGKKKAREEYDAYLESLGETRAAEEALSGEHEIPPELAGPPSVEPPAVQPMAAVPKPPPAPPSKQSSPTEEGRRVAREVLQKRMDGMRSQSRSRPVLDAPPSDAKEPSDAPPAVPRTQKEALRDLTASLRGAAAMTGGLDQVARNLAEARRAVEANDLATAVRAFRLALALAPGRADIESEHAKYAKELAITLADRYETQALYEERYKKWGSAATSWAKVIEGRPDDTRAMTHAAIALVEAKGDLHNARQFAQKATTLEPNDAAARRALGRVFLAAGLALNARRELEHARNLDPSDELTRLLLREVEAQTKA